VSQAIRSGLASLLQVEVLPTPPERIGGGCINECYRYVTRTGTVFAKVAAASSVEMFEAEAAGLQELAAAKAIRVPRSLAVGARDGHALLVLEWLELRQPTAETDAACGERLAAQHRITKPLFGWKRANYIGATSQSNLWSRDWVNFWRTHRFDAQLNLAVSKGADSGILERAALLSALMDGFFTSYLPEASLLHGDLWSGNYAADLSGAPVVFDPAVYYGDRECDIAMTQLFGGFGAAFYAAYESAWPLDSGWRERVGLYNLYHLLNHFNLFGGNYLLQADTLIEKLLSELGH